MLFGSIGCSAEQLSSEALIAAKGVCPEASDNQIKSAMGDLNGDNIPDVAILLSCRSREDQELMVLHGQRGGSYKIAYRSQVWPWNGRSEIELEIRKGTLVLSEHCAYNCNPESWRSKYKFATRNNRLILVGEDHISTLLSGKDFEVENESGNSVNYLIQKVIYWGRETGRGYSERKLAFKLKEPLKFTDFNLETCQIHRFCMPASMMKSPPTKSINLVSTQGEKK